MQQTHTFHKQQAGWFIDLPQYIEDGGSHGDLAMVEGADTMLDIISEGADKVTLHMDTHPFGKADILELIAVCEPAKGGGNYLLRWWQGKEIMQAMWLCDVTEYVFGELPERIYMERVR